MNPERLRLSEDAARHRNWKRWGPTFPNASGARFARTTPKTGTSGPISRTSTRAAEPIAGAKTGYSAFATGRAACFALALWNGQDPILKERLFGLGTKEGNHGEDVKECYFYVDSTPTHSYMKALYKYPQRAFPYDELVAENKRRSRADREFELIDTGIFNESRYFDIQVEYAKNSPDDILIRIRATNRGPGAAPLHILPTLWFRNTWAWGRTGEGYSRKPSIVLATAGDTVITHHETLGGFALQTLTHPDEWLFTENETDFTALFGEDHTAINASLWVKDAFHRYIVKGESGAVNRKNSGTKTAALYKANLAPGASIEICMRLHPPGESRAIDFDAIFAQRIADADQFYGFSSEGAPSGEQRIARRAEASLLWSKQFYNYGVLEWLEGDPAYPKPPESRCSGRNRGWRHLYNRDIISMPDNWEFPWYASWDLAFHTVAFAELDPDFAKDQLVLFLREWYMHPSGQILRPPGGRLGPGGQGGLPDQADLSL